jgi:bifunctional enzyme CysN/CysC
MTNNKNLYPSKLEVTFVSRALQKQQAPKCIWLTGLSGAGKTSVATLLDKRLFELNKHVYVLDGDNLRSGLTNDLGYKKEDRVENIRRVAEVAKLFVDAGLIVIVCLISPYRSERLMARNMFQADHFLEVYVDASLEVCESRDVKGLYARARKGEIIDFTGIDSPYEPPLHPEIHLDTSQSDLDACVHKILNAIL